MAYISKQKNRSINGISCKPNKIIKELKSRNFKILRVKKNSKDKKSLKIF